MIDGLFIDDMLVYARAIFKRRVRLRYMVAA